MPTMKAAPGNLVWHDRFKTNVLAEEEGTGANRENGEGNENLCSLRSLLFKSGCRRGADFVFLTRDTSLAAPACRAEGGRRRKSDEGGSPYIDNRLPALHSLGDGGREYKAVYVLSDAEIGLFSDEVVVNCAP